MGRAHELGSSLQVTLAADLGLGPLVEERSLVSDLGELEAEEGLQHAPDTPAEFTSDEDVDEPVERSP